MKEIALGSLMPCPGQLGYEMETLRSFWSIVPSASVRSPSSTSILMASRMLSAMPFWNTFVPTICSAKYMADPVANASSSDSVAQAWVSSIKAQYAPYRLPLASCSLVTARQMGSSKRNLDSVLSIFLFITLLMRLRLFLGVGYT